MSYLTRRQLITGRVARFGPAQPAIRSRQEWAPDHPAKGPLDTEDVRFLIVHHSASHNGHTGAETPAILRSFYEFHTSGRGWNDIAYNFLIDSEGGIWEGRTGSLEGPVAGDATGGNQGFSQLVCVIGDFGKAQPTDAATASLVVLLAWLADRYDVATAAGSVTEFVSRGSNRHPIGAEVKTATITGHRNMSRTSCPGDNLNAYVEAGLMADVEAFRVAATPSTTTYPPSTTTTAMTTTSSLAIESEPVPTMVTSTMSPLAVGKSPSADLAGIFAAAGAVVALGIGAAVWRYRRMRRD